MAFVRNKGNSTSRVGVQRVLAVVCKIKLQVSETENSTGVVLVAAASQAHLWSGTPVHDNCFLEASIHRGGVTAGRGIG